MQQDIHTFLVLLSYHMFISNTGSPWVWFYRRGRVPGEKNQPKILMDGTLVRIGEITLQEPITLKSLRLKTIKVYFSFTLRVY